MKGSGWHNKHIAELVNNRECTPNTTGRKRENAYYAHGTGCDTWKRMYSSPESALIQIYSTV